jgi:hypothetical protein
MTASYPNMSSPRTRAHALQVLAFLGAPALRLAPGASIFGRTAFDAICSSPSTFSALYSTALGWAVSFLALFGTVIYLLSSGDTSVRIPLRVLGVVGSLSSFAFFIPLVALLLSVYDCGVLPMWTDLGFTCYEGSHLALAIVTGPLVLSFLLLVALFAGTYFETHPLSAELLSKVHGE